LARQIFNGRGNRNLLKLNQGMLATSGAGALVMADASPVTTSAGAFVTTASTGALLATATRVGWLWRQ